LGVPSGNVQSGDDLEITVTDVLEPENDPNCNCGIMFRGKDLGLCPDTLLAEDVGTIRGQVEIQVSGGEILGHKVGYDYYVGNEFPVTRISRAFDGTGWGKDFWEQEKISYDRQLGVVTGNDSDERYFKNAQSRLNLCEQYDTATVKVRRKIPSGGFSQRTEEYLRYIFVIPQKKFYSIKNFFQSALP